MQITYEDKVALNENTGIADINKVKADDMNMIKNVVNANQEDVGDISNLKTKDITSIVNAVNEIEEGNYYSTEEKQIGKWIDNKPLYRKTFVINGNSSTGQQNYQFDLASLNWETVTFIYGTTYQETNSYYRDLHNAYAYDSTATSEYSGAWTSGTLLRVRSRGIAVAKFYVTLEYTKTTDSPSS